MGMDIFDLSLLWIGFCLIQCPLPQGLLPT